MSPTRPPADLLADIASTPVQARPGVYRAALDRSWSFILPSGGVLMSVALGAMKQALGAQGGRHSGSFRRNACISRTVCRSPLASAMAMPRV